MEDLPGMTAAPQVVDRIRQDIDLGVLAPGGWLKQIDLERRYGCTRAEVRIALERLAAERLVRHVPNRGYHVEEFDQRTLHHISKVRAILEMAAAEEVLAAIPSDALPGLTVLAERFARATREGTLAEQSEANLAFHRAMLDHCANPDLVAQIFELRRRLPIAVQQRKNTPARMQTSAEDHFQMIAALAARDLARLRRIIWDHVVERAAEPQEVVR